MQPHVQHVSTNYSDKTVTLLVGDLRIEYFLHPDLFLQAIRSMDYSVRMGWSNQAVTNLLIHSTNVKVLRTHPPPFQQELTMKPPGSSNRPSDDFPWTLIAPEAMKGLFYQGERVWWPTESDAKEYAAEIFEKNKDKQAFELAVVNYTLLLKPKPQIEMSEVRRQEIAKVNNPPAIM